MSWYAKHNKYGNKSCKCNSKHIHDSRGEAGYCNILLLQQKSGEIKSYKTQVNYDLKVKGKQVCRHIVDFVVTTNEGKREVREYKGFCTDVFILKHKLFKAVYPGIEYIIIKHR